MVGSPSPAFSWERGLDYKGRVKIPSPPTPLPWRGRGALILCFYRHGMQNHGRLPLARVFVGEGVGGEGISTYCGIDCLRVCNSPNKFAKISGYSAPSIVAIDVLPVVSV